MVTDHFLRGTPLGQRLTKDLEDAREILPLKAAGADDGPTIAIKDQHTVEPLSVNLDQIAQTTS